MKKTNHRKTHQPKQIQHTRLHASAQDSDLASAISILYSQNFIKWYKWKLSYSFCSFQNFKNYRIWIRNAKVMHKILAQVCTKHWVHYNNRTASLQEVFQHFNQRISESDTNKSCHTLSTVSKILKILIFRSVTKKLWSKYYQERNYLRCLSTQGSDENDNFPLCRLLNQSKPKTWKLWYISQGLQNIQEFEIPIKKTKVMAKTLISH